MRRIPLVAVALFAGCAAPVREPVVPDFLASEVRVTRHESDDDLLTAGLGLDALRAALPAPADTSALDARALRRRAIHASWRGIADLASADTYRTLPSVAGREYHAFARVPGAKQPHRVLAQVPDAFDHAARCLVVSPASGSRGVYGAIAVGGAWGLPRGCAMVYTDKGAGSGYFDFDTGEGVALDGTRAPAGGAMLEFEPTSASAGAAHRVAIKHAHSQDNPEAAWGEHVLQAARFGLHALDSAFPGQAPFTAQNTRVIAAAVSNGGGAVLRAGEIDADGMIDAVVAFAPNVSAPGARGLFDYASEAALYSPCALAAIVDAPAMLPEAAAKGLSALRCTSLRAAGLLESTSPEAQAAEALARLRANGWTDAALRLSSTNVAFDLWRAVVATYAQAYARADVGTPVCGYGFAALDATGAARAATAAERALWWSDAPGIAPAAGIGVVDTLTQGVDAGFRGLLCARKAFDGDEAREQRLHVGIEQVRATANPRAPFTLIVHGVDDGLVPIAFTSRPYAAAARANGARIAKWEVARAQHFDAFLVAPPLRARYRPLLPVAYEALDQVWAMLVNNAAAPEDRTVD